MKRYAPLLFVKVTLYSVYVYGRGTLCQAHPPDHLPKHTETKRHTKSYMATGRITNVMTSDDEYWSYVYKCKFMYKNYKKEPVPLTISTKFVTYSLVSFIPFSFIVIEFMANIPQNLFLMIQLSHFHLYLVFFRSHTWKMLRFVQILWRTSTYTCAPSLQLGTILLNINMLTIIVTTSGTQMRVRDSSATRIFF